MGWSQRRRGVRSRRAELVGTSFGIDGRTWRRSAVLEVDKDTGKYRCNRRRYGDVQRVAGSELSGWHRLDAIHGIKSAFYKTPLPSPADCPLSVSVLGVGQSLTIPYNPSYSSLLHSSSPSPNLSSPCPPPVSSRATSRVRLSALRYVSHSFLSASPSSSNGIPPSRLAKSHDANAPTILCSGCSGCSGLEY
jgi:hypothetical protein